MNWIPRNKATGVEYTPIDDATKAQWESDPNLKGKYTYKKTDAPATTGAPKTQPPPKVPVGVPPPTKEKPEGPKEQ